jgi:iron complex outermembrane receptor protein
MTRTLGLALGILLPLTAWSADPALSTRELADLSLEELANFEITSVSRKTERLSDAPASVFVITADDIRRSGARTLADVLRLAPNLQVAQASATGYAVRARGVFNTAANKLLVLIDGRSVYTPLFAGVFWDVQDVVLDDVERIEVVSGPGGALWGVNAVNGVINVITKAAGATQGTLITGGGGNADSDAAVRYGGKIADGHYRVYGKYFDRSHSSTASGAAVKDAGHLAHAGFRGDWARSRDRFTVHVGIYDGTMDQPEPGAISISGIPLALGAIPVSGINVAGGWTRRYDDGSELSLQAYADRTERDIPPTFGEKLDLYNLLLQHSLRPSERISLVWGGEYRVGKDRLVNSTVFGFLPANLTQRWASLFAQGEIHVAKDVRLIGGARIERNDYTGVELLPTLRAAWKPGDDSLLWAAASRAVRAPSRLDRDPFVPSTPPFLLAGGPGAPSEKADVFELGYRGTAHGRFGYSVTAFRADYHHLHTQELAPSRTFLVFDGKLAARTYGVEMWGTWQAAKPLRISVGYMAERERFHLEAGSNDAAAASTALRDPAHAWLVRTSFNAIPHIEIDVTVRGVASLSNPSVPAYRTADARVGWQAGKDLEIFVAGRNLADGGHGEVGNVVFRKEIERSVYVGLRWQFGVL